MALGAEYREDNHNVDSTKPEVRSALPDASAVIQQLFFPESEVRVDPVSAWSPNVLEVTVDGESTYIAKSYPEGSKDLQMLASMQAWAAAATHDLPIAVPQYLPSIEGDYFPVAGDQDRARICLMEKLPLAPFELSNMQDFERMGIALGVLHKLAPVVTKNVPVFRFAYTNAEVESYWQYLDQAEQGMFNRVLVNEPNTEQVIQLTHNDLHPANLLSSQGTPAFIDFDQMLLGPRVNDFGQLLSSFWLDNTGESFEESIRHFLVGYSQVNIVEPSEVSAIPNFALRKIFISFAWFKGLMNIRGDQQAADFYAQLKRRAEVLFQYAVERQLI